MTTNNAPINALAQFFDDIRVELNGKLILVGQYINEIIIPSNNPMPVDRLAILVTLRWPRDYDPKTVAIRAELSGQPPIVQELPPPLTQDFSGKPISPFSGVTAQMSMHCRFLPLRGGDYFDVWAVIDGTEIPAGRLGVVIAPPLSNNQRQNDAGP